MNTFVIIFRRRMPALAGEERQRLNDETAAWAKQHSAHKLDPRILSADRSFFGPADPTGRDNDWILSALLFLEARDLQEAATIAQSHPGTRYGFTAEVRPWARPGAAARS